MALRLPKLTAGDRSFLRNVITFMGRRSIAVAITFLLTPVVARLFTPAHWGVATLFIAICNAIGPVAALQYQRAIPVAKEHAEARALVRLCAWVSVLVQCVIITAGCLLFFTSWMQRTASQLSLWLWLIPVGIALESGTTILQSWVLRHKLYDALGNSEVAQALSRTGMRVGAGAASGSSIAGLISSYLIAYGATLGILLRACKGSATLRQDASELYSVRELASRYRDFPKFNAPVGVLMQATRQLPVFILAAYFGSAAAGYFGMADRLLRTPLNITTNTVGQVFLQKISDTANAGKSIRPALIKTVLGLAAIAIVPTAIIWVYGQEIIVFALGANWAAAGRMAEIMAPYLFVQWLAPPFQGAAIVMRRQRQWFYSQTISAASRLVIVPAAIFWATTAEGIVAIYVWTTLLTQAVSMGILAKSIPAVRDSG
jgi:O-antigen/teichoic acid export membrane protein